MKRQAKDLRRKTLDSRHSMWFTWSTLGVMIFMSLLSSCEKVIDMDLNSSESKLVVEGTIQEDSICRVRLSHTSNFFDPKSSNAVTSATVTLLTNTGTQEVLTHVGQGLYQSIALTGEVGRIYTLQIDYEGEQYEATSSLLDTPPIDSLIPQEYSFGSTTPNWLAVVFQDNPTRKDYYRIQYINNGQYKNEADEISLIDDDIASDNHQIESLNPFVNYYSGDVAVVELYRIDQGLYNYYSSLQDVASSGGLNAAAPYNPTSNVSNGALGYFGAWSLSRDTIVIP